MVFSLNVVDEAPMSPVQQAGFCYNVAKMLRKTSVLREARMSLFPFRQDYTHLFQTNE